MELSIRDRIVLIQLLPEQHGGLVNLQRLRELREALSFSEEEETELGIVVDSKSGNVRWKPEAADHRKEVELWPWVLGKLRDRLAELDEQEMLVEGDLELYRRLGYTGEADEA